MATTKKKTTSKNEEVVEEVKAVEEAAPVEEKVEEKVEPVEEKAEKKAPEAKKGAKTLKFPIGSIVYIARDAEADLHGFKLFPQYKKCTYTVEAYDGYLDAYILRRLNLSLALKEADIVSPDERANDQINRKQF